MVLTPSRMIKLGSSAADFELIDVVSGQCYTLNSFKGKEALLVMFICRHCPYVQHIKNEISRMERDYKAKDIAFVAISSNDAVHYPDDAPDKLKEMALEQKWSFPLLYDETQKVAKAYEAACTPDFFLYNRDRKLVYRGQLDESRPGSQKPVTGKDLRDAIDLVLIGQDPASFQKASIGCNIKWKKGQEPQYKN